MPKADSDFKFKWQQVISKLKENYLNFLLKLCQNLLKPSEPVRTVKCAHIRSYSSYYACVNID
jgi:hypothetical protein